MRILYSVQRYGEEIVGGSETACRLFCENLVKRGHDVTVLTSCALSYVDWSDYYQPGDSVLNGVKVRRLKVERTRDIDEFSRLHASILTHPESASQSEIHAWLSSMGPVLRHYSSEIRRLAKDSDVAVFMTYLYPTTVYGLFSVVGELPTVLQPTAHNEPPAYVSVYESVFRAADSFLFLTEEEKQVVENIYGFSPQGAVSGIGMNLDVSLSTGAAFRKKYELGDSPYIVYVGRLDTFKGVSELMRYFVEFKGRNPSSLRLVLAGEKVMDLPSVEDIVHVGFLSDEEKADAIAGAVALVQPSPFESFSIVLCEAWLQSRPVLVQGYSDVLKGQVTRSEGGLPYTNFAEFEGCLQHLLDNSELADDLGRNGHRYVVENYDWDTVLRHFEDAVEIARQRHSQRKKESLK